MIVNSCFFFFLFFYAKNVPFVCYLLIWLRVKVRGDVFYIYQKVLPFPVT